MKRNVAEFEADLQGLCSEVSSVLLLAFIRLNHLLIRLVVHLKTCGLYFYFIFSFLLREIQSLKLIKTLTVVGCCCTRARAHTNSLFSVQLNEQRRMCVISFSCLFITKNQKKKKKKLKKNTKTRIHDESIARNFN